MSTAALAFFGLAMLGIALVPRGVNASSILSNGSFEMWAGGRPASWGVLAGSVERDTDHAASGAAAHLTGTSRAQIQQLVPASPGGTYSASVMVSGSGRASVQLQFMDESFGSLSGNVPGFPATLGPGYVALQVAATAPAGAGFVGLSINVLPDSGPISVYIDEATLEESLPLPTAVPTPTNTPANTPVATATDSVMPSDSPTPGASTKTATATKTPTSTRTPKPDTPTKTPTPRKDAPATSTPKPPKFPTATPTPRISHSTFGALIENGDFEDIDGDQPASWSKYGGTMSITADAYHGSWSGTLDSDTASTKWLYEIAEVTGGAWYRASGAARASGGEAWIRLSWYASRDGSGSAIDSADSIVGDSTGWSSLDTGAVQAPESAASVRVRLMLRPTAGNAQAAFDDIELVEADAPPPTPTPTPAPIGSDETPAPGTAARSTPTPRIGVSSGPARVRTADAAPAGAISPGPATLRLSELLSDPENDGPDAAWEWIELVNVGDVPVDTAGWKLADRDGADVLPSAIIEPGGFAVVAAKSAQVAVPVVLRVPDGTIGGHGLNNGGDEIHLLAPDGSEIDALSYGDSDAVFAPSPPAPGAGKTLGVRTASGDPAAENWAVTDHPTPGEPNIFPEARKGGEQAAPGDPSGPRTLAALPFAQPETKPAGSAWSTLGLGAGAGVAAMAIGVIGYSQRRRLASLVKRGTRGG